MKNNNKDYTLPVEKTHYKKKYLLRKLEEEEAEKEIEEYEEEDHSETCFGCAGGFCFLHGKL